MEVVAVSKSVRIAPRKVRLVADAVRKLELESAISSLSLINKRAADPLLKTIKSAIANAKNNNKLEAESLKIKSIDVLEAQSYKRFHPSTRGRVHAYKRRGSHIKVVLTDGVKVEKLKVETSLKKTVNKKESEDKEKGGKKS